MKKVVLLGTLLGVFCGAAKAQPPVVNATEGIFDFEDGRTIFSTLGDDAKLSLDTNNINVKAGRASLRFDYVIAPNKMDLLLKTGQPGEASRLKTFRFWAKSDYATNLVMVLQEQDSGRWMSTFHLPKNVWQRVELSVDDFELTSNVDDPKDNNGKLDMDLVSAAALADYKQIFAATDNEEMKKILGIKAGPHTFWLDDFEASKEPLPKAPEDPLGATMLDDFVHPQLNWTMLGDMLLKRVTEEQMKQVGRPVSVIGQGLQAEYRQQVGGIVGLTKMLQPGLLKDMVALRFAVATEQAMTLLIQLEETSGGKYNTTIELPADNKPGEVRLVPMLFEVAQDSKDNNKRLDLEQVKQILFVDATGLLGGAVNDNALWISKLRIEKKPQ